MTLEELLRVLRRRVGLIVAILFIPTVAAALIALARPPVYTAESVLVLGDTPSFVDRPDGALSPPLDFAALRTELDVLSSGMLAREIVDKAALMADPEFNRRLASPAGSSPLAGVSRWLKSRIGVAASSGWWSWAMGPDEASDPRPTPAVGPERDPADALVDVVEAMQSHLRVLNDGRSYTIRVQFESRSADKATRIANLVVETYLINQSVAKSTGARLAADRLSGRIEELRAQVRDAEQAVQRFRERNQLIETNGSTMNSQQLSELSTQLILARTERAQVEARYKRIQELEKSPGGLEAASEVLSSSLIQRLREQESDLARQQAEISSTYGDKHPKMINLRSQIQDLDRKILEEVGKVAKSVASDVEVSRTREATLTRNLGELQQRLADGARAGVQLRELEREAETRRQTLKELLTQVKAIGERDALAAPGARILSRAVPPREISSTKPQLIIVAALVASAFLAMAAAVAIDRLEPGYFGAEEVEGACGLPVFGMIPTIPRRGRWRSKILDYVLDRPSSVFAESVRAAWTTIVMTLGERATGVILVTSARTGEGKTVFSASLARQVAGTGRRVLLIEADLAKPSLLAGLKLSPKGYLNDLFKPDVTAEDLPARARAAMTRDSRGELNILAANPHGAGTHGLLGSDRMSAILAIAREDHDLVVIDAPPVMAVSEVARLRARVDLSLYLIRWRVTPRRLARGGLSHLAIGGKSAIGVLISRVNLRRHRAMGLEDRSSQYGRLGDYFVN